MRHGGSKQRSAFPGFSLGVIGDPTKVVVKKNGHIGVCGIGVKWATARFPSVTKSLMVEELDVLGSYVRFLLRYQRLSSRRRCASLVMEKET